MRIIAGEFRGRRLKRPLDRRTRPTADRVREAWLGILEPHLAGAVVLDLFAGSGAIGLEALSRGAVRVDFVERARSSMNALKANVAALGVDDRVAIYRDDAVRYVSRLDESAYDIAFADPPYESEHPARLLDVFRERPFARILGIEHGAGLALAGDETRRYGDVALTFCYAQ